ncbi:GntP family permease [Parapedobacter sp. DT-150]|uniref:GntP family permease n=1 Tax=Parapedobacter sp. DT-150 TaxID=3396162 RepID=UPI003F1BFB8E
MDKMQVSIAALVLTVAFVVWSTARKKWNPFFALALAALGVGLLTGMPLPEIVEQLKVGFGNTLGKVGVLIILGTVLGGVLEKTGATVCMAEYLISRVSKRNAPLGIALTGYVIGFPLFCDSGFIVLNGLNHSMVKKTHWTMAVMATALATSLYAVHCLVPPHPGMAAAIETVGGDFGTIMLMGALLAIPAAAVGLFFARWKGRRVTDDYAPSADMVEQPSHLPPVWLSFLPVLLPIFLIACGSCTQLFSAELQQFDALAGLLLFVGDPSVALGVGICAALFLVKRADRKQLTGRRCGESGCYYRHYRCRWHVWSVAAAFGSG